MSDDRSDRYLLMKRDLYWRPNGAGYTGIKEHAGRYTKAECSPYDTEPDHLVTVIHEDDAPDYSPACFEDLKLAHITAERDSLSSRVRELEEALRDLYRGYVNTMEAGRDRIISLGGTCDPVDRMEEGDPVLIRARSLLPKGEGKMLGGEVKS